MTFAAVTLLGMTVGQPLGPDYYPMNSRTIKLPIEYKKDRKTIRHVLLYVARNGENTWYQEAFVAPNKEKGEFVYVAKDDGLYWFKMVIEDLKGNKDPADLTRDPPDLKIVIDTVPPQVRFTNAKRSGEEIVVEWSVEDKFPNDAETTVQFRVTDNPESYWRLVRLPANSRTGVKFPCNTNEGITVKVTAVDVAGNRTEVTKDFPAAGTTALSPPGSTPPVATNTVIPPPAPADVIPVGTGGPLSPVGPAPIFPPPAPLAPVAGPASGVVTPAAVPVVPPPITQPPVTPPTPPVGRDPLVFGPSRVPGGVDSSVPVVSNPPAYQPPTQPPAGNGGPTPLPTVDPKVATTPVVSTAPTWSGAAPVAETPRAQVINYPRFDLGYDLEQRGPSGIKRVDLWVTRDEGKSWIKWSEHDGKGGAVRVMLDVPRNPQQLEGSYGFRLVPVSGAGLSEKEPVGGSAPEMRVILDTTAPQLELFLPSPTPNAPAPPPDTLVIGWQATDRNFGDDPITLEWSETPTGPWKSVPPTENDPVIQTAAITAPAVKRLANVGQYAWRVPAGTPAHVYLKATARDAAGNVTEKVTVQPITVDLTKPRAKINGIVPPPVTPRP